MQLRPEGIGLVKISVVHGGPDLVLKIDDRVISSSLVGVGVAVNPGHHVVSATAHGESKSTPFDAREGGVEEVRLELPPEPPPAIATPAGPAPADDAPAPPRRSAGSPRSCRSASRSPAPASPPAWMPAKQMPSSVVVAGKL